jgi:hypothetical protein
MPTSVTAIPSPPRASVTVLVTGEPARRVLVVGGSVSVLDARSGAVLINRRAECCESTIVAVHQGEIDRDTARQIRAARGRRGTPRGRHPVNPPLARMGNARLGTVGRRSMPPIHKVRGRRGGLGCAPVAASSAFSRKLTAAMRDRRDQAVRGSGMYRRRVARRRSTAATHDEADRHDDPPRRGGATGDVEGQRTTSS